MWMVVCAAPIWLLSLGVCFRVARTSVSTAAVMLRLDGLRAEVVGWQVAHDHTVGELDRRMRGVEAAAARAEAEARVAANLVAANMAEPGYRS